MKKEDWQGRARGVMMMRNLFSVGGTQEVTKMLLGSFLFLVEKTNQRLFWLLK